MQADQCLLGELPCLEVACNAALQGLSDLRKLFGDAGLLCTLRGGQLIGPAKQEKVDDFALG